MSVVAGVMCGVTGERGWVELPKGHQGLLAWTELLCALRVTGNSQTYVSSRIAQS